METVWSSKKAHYPPVRLHGPVPWKSTVLQIPVKGGEEEERMVC